MKRSRERNTSGAESFLVSLRPSLIWRQKKLYLDPVVGAKLDHRTLVEKTVDIRVDGKRGRSKKRRTKGCVYVHPEGESGRDVRRGEVTVRWLKKWDQALESSLALARRPGDYLDLHTTKVHPSATNIL